MVRALGRYELLRPLARGGMAEVYLARRRAAGVEKWLVVKRMRPETSGDPRFLDLFVREARLSMSLVHQNIVPVFDFGRIDDQVFLAMERVEGKDLGSSLARARPHRVPPLLAAFVAAECCQALDYAHQRKSPDGVALGVVHRDVTPRNVLLSWSGEVKLTDFGIAALAGEATSRLLGTPQYMAPEQARSEPIDPRADIYAVGLVLREAVTGVRARPGRDRDTILDAARRGQLLPWSHRAAAIPRPTGELAIGSGDHGPEEPAVEAPLPAALVAIIDRATAALPGDRYPDARSMLEELDSFIVGERAAHKAESPARQLAAWLATVWEGARDDVETDAAIVGDHLVSFLDDGALDVIGTGTVRSLAATAADDAQVAPAPPPAAVLAAAASVAPPITTPAAVVPVTRPVDPAVRPGRISSSTATVASGSFHTLPTVPSTNRASEIRRRKRRQISPIASIVLVGVATGAAVFFIMNSFRGRDRQSTAQAITAQPGAGQPIPAQSNAGQPTAAQPATAQSSAGQSDAGQPDAAQPSAGQPNTTQSDAGRPAAGQHPRLPQDTGRPLTGPQDASHPHIEPPHTRPLPPGLPHGGQQNAVAAEHDGSGSASAPSSEGSDQVSPARCQVRINLTPWAYYTADDDTTRRETPSTVELTPGRHRLHVWNPELHVERDITLTVPADRDTMNYSEPLQPSTPAPDAGSSS
jgi:tRNA A-37 threonylcarbamoyl transferase component Bud32